MMNLMLMKNVVDTVDEHWRSTFAERMLAHWEYDEGSVYYFRASANFIFVFSKDGKRYFLRCNSQMERSLQSIESELALLEFLASHSLQAAQPVLSRHERQIEEIDTPLGVFYGVVFEGLPGEHLELEELKEFHFREWGKTLGRLHHVIKQIPDSNTYSRPHIVESLKRLSLELPERETAAKEEADILLDWMSSLPRTNNNYGLIHYDFELDNLYWHEKHFSMLDFDDCMQHWYAADIAYALRDLFAEDVNLESPSFKQFLAGYMEETTIDNDLLHQLHMFIRVHDFMTFARLVRSLNAEVSENHPDWFNQLIQKLRTKISNYKIVFEERHQTRLPQA